MSHPYYVEAEFDEPRVPGPCPPAAVHRPATQLGGPLLEVMVEVTPPRDIHVFHVMQARQKHLDRMEEKS
jgi:hypothetical protein